MNQIPLQTVLDQAVEVLKDGGIILYPADTVWGIGCDACNSEAVLKVAEIKGRDESKPFIILVSSIEQLKEVVPRIHPRVETLLTLHIRPLTIIYPSVFPAYQHLCGTDGSLAIRIVHRGFCRSLLQAFGRPIISTSANEAGDPTPLRFGMINTEIIKRVDYTVPAIFEKGITGKPSQIARYDKHGELTFLR